MGRHKSIRGTDAFRAPLLVVLAAVGLWGQSGAFISGSIRDRSGLPLVGAEVRVQSETTGIRQKLTADGQGRFSSSQLIPGVYKVVVRSAGFRSAMKSGVAVQPGQARLADFTLDVLPVHQEVTIEAKRDDIDPGADGVTVSRGSSATKLPSNGHDLHPLFSILPGSAVTPASTSDGGQFTVSGQRPDTNSFRIDGVSGNSGVGATALPGAFPGANLPGMTAFGGTQSLASSEEVQSVEVRSSDFAPESADRPGAQLIVETRSGTSDFHGSMFGYLRPQMFNSSDWFAKACGSHIPRSRLDGWGGSAGGPLLANRTFFFASAEEMSLASGAISLISVPSISQRRQSESSLYGSLVNAFPAPQSCGFESDPNVGTLAVKQTGSAWNRSLRLDHILSPKARLFARFAYDPSSSTTNELTSGNPQFQWLTATAGATFTAWGWINDGRFNFTRARARSTWTSAVGSSSSLLGILGALPSFQTVFSWYPPVVSLSIPGVGQFVSGSGGRTYQDQLEGIYKIGKSFGRHSLLVGGDYINLQPGRNSSLNTVSLVSPSFQALSQADPLNVTLSFGGSTRANITIGSAFIQDTYRLSDRLNLIYGARWELTPPVFRSTQYENFGSWQGPGFPFQVATGVGPPTAIAFSENITSRQLFGSVVWHKNFAQIAPRVGLAYRINKSGLVLLAGAGLFYDTGLASALNPVNGTLFNSWQFSGNSVSPEMSDPPTGSVIIPYPTVPGVQLPRSIEWRASLEKSVASRSLVSVAYVGSSADQLLRLETGRNVTSGLPMWMVYMSDGTSAYQALQAKYSGNITGHVFGLVSYSWGHSIDTVSRSSSVFEARPNDDLRIDRGSSNFDLRHTLNASIAYNLDPSQSPSRLIRIAHGWVFSSTVQARTGFPIDISSEDRSLGLGFDNSARPNLVPGEPMWIGASDVPGGRRLNPAAFQAVPLGIQGTLGRNVIVGNPLFQIDANATRTFRLTDRISGEFRASAFNLFNHASFGDANGYLGGPWFGRPTSMTNLMLGSGSPSGGLNPLFQAGGPRTVEIHFKLSF